MKYASSPPYEACMSRLLKQRYERFCTSTKGSGSRASPLQDVGCREQLLQDAVQGERVFALFPSGTQ